MFELYTVFLVLLKKGHQIYGNGYIHTISVLFMWVFTVLFVQGGRDELFVGQA